MQIYTLLLAFVVCLWPRSVLRHYTKILLFGGEREHAVLQISYSLVIFIDKHLKWRQFLLQLDVVL